ncbi:MAG: hypothetical protein KDB80_03905 [Planctomycetes bacterium]|nr:hypothetical protein [Planctomycetota bacterium]
MRHLLRRPLLSLIELWQFAAVVASALTVVWIVVRTAQATSEVTRSRHEVETCLARALAEQHALLAAVDARAPSEIRRGDYDSVIDVAAMDGRRFATISVSGRIRSSFAFRCELLPGALPRALRQPLTIRGSFDNSLVVGIDPLELRAALSPEIELPAIGDGSEWDMEAVGAARRRTFARDDSIALLRIRSGTDQIDYVLVPDEDGVVRPRFPTEGLLVLDGNLWVDRGRGAVRIEIDRNATLVVRGNVYVGRSVSVVGGGHLVVAAERDPRNGWSEGSGCVFVGLPEDDLVSGRVVRIEASLVSSSDCLVSAGQAQVAGAFVVGGDLRARGEGCRLGSDGSLLLDSRASQPGIEVVGGPLPGRLERIKTPDSDR